MKKMFTLGLLALAISASAEAKSVEKLKNTTKNEKSKKAVVLKSFDCQTGMTSCGWSYSSCANYDQDPLEVYDQMEALAC